MSSTSLALLLLAAAAQAASAQEVGVPREQGDAVRLTATPVTSTNQLTAPIVAPPAAPAQPLRALVEKFGAGDRAWLSGDYRTALFAYQDATYLDPTSAAARIRLARAYQALRHEDLARQQLTLALELDPENAEARRLLEGLKAPPATGTSQAGSSATPAGAPADGGAQKVYKLTEDPDTASPPGARPPEPKAPEPVRPAPTQPR